MPWSLYPKVVIKMTMMTTMTGTIMIMGEVMTENHTNQSNFAFRTFEGRY